MGEEGELGDDNSWSDEDGVSVAIQCLVVVILVFERSGACDSEKWA